VDQPGNNFLSDTGLTEDQDFGLGPRRALDFQTKRRHCRALAK
jgi:hypothetical protein